ncbi:prostaglandin reductase 1-like [Schistocerca americana]|uniref:prostaglandin reductase 1-like n=1 Tax=Schistocerca americana TaxID=7009 RepID=UPI001F501949|nr:prostaglandin reductase 1-like [Schistocerca americana]XP_047121540.1 prostaglandin reductase 1-like [Schistocerca piceifrons]
MVKARKIVIARVFQGEPRLQDFRIEEEDLPALRDGQILAEAVYISVDPYQRAYKNMHQVGATMIGSQVARIVESRAADFPVGRYVVGYWGWRDRTVADVGPDAPYFMSPVMLVPDLGELPLSLSLGVLGMPGITAYFGLLEICKPKEGEVAVVSGAAGAVGSIVGQIARLKGCKVIGFAGSDAKVKWLKEELGFHHAFNYKTNDVTEALKQAAPDGVDVYFDNVGGEMSSAIINSMREYGRISVCGAISGYNESNLPKATIIQHAAIFKQLRMEGFMYIRWHDRWGEGIGQLMQWIREGKIKYHETVTDGFQNTPKAFVGMLQGENLGKAVVKV